MADTNGTPPPDLYRKHRPTRPEDVVGQAAAVKVIKAFGAKVPHCVMLHGPSGVGKTTLARIVARRLLDCSSNDLTEINTGSVRNVLDMVRDLERDVHLSPLGGKSRVWILDEVQSLSRARHAQEALLKVLEEIPAHAYFFLCTTDPRKIIPTVVGRCTKIALTAVGADDLTALVDRVAAAEKFKPPRRVVEKIVKSADGSARQALVELQKVMGIAGEADQLDAVGPAGADKAAEELVAALLPFNKQPASWDTVREILGRVKDEDPESVRQRLLGIARGTLINNRPGPAAERANLIIEVLRDPFYERNTGWAVFASCCYVLCTARK